MKGGKTPMNVRNKEKGFTIIEVVLVLAIAGLIFLMVFIALPAQQRSQRDTQRRDDVSRFMSQLNSYSTNNRGAIVTNQTQLNGFSQSYLRSGDGEFNDPKTGEGYDVRVSNNGSAVPGEGVMFYHVGAKCNGENAVSAGPREAAVRVALEGGGIYCQSNK